MAYLLNRFHGPGAANVVGVDGHHEGGQALDDRWAADIDQPVERVHPGLVVHIVECADKEFQRRFIANAAHELRTPIAILSLRLDELPDGKAKQRQKRGGGAVRLSLEEALLIGDGQDEAILEIHEALERLEAFDARKARVVELVYFGGLEQDLAADMMNVNKL